MTQTLIFISRRLSFMVGFGPALPSGVGDRNFSAGRPQFLNPFVRGPGYGPPDVNGTPLALYYFMKILFADL